MPGVDGVELMNFIHHHYPKIRILLLSRQGELEIALDAVALGVYAIFRKPLAGGNIDGLGPDFERNEAGI